MIRWSFSPAPTTSFQKTMAFFEYIWKIYTEPIFWRLLSILCFLMSLVVVWSECTFSFHVGPKDKALSIFELLVHIPNLPGYALQLCILIPLSYITLCSYISIFHIRLFHVYHLVPHQGSDAYSLFFCSGLLTRLIVPLAYNFLLLIGEGHSDKGQRDLKNYPAFDEVMSDMDSFMENVRDYFKYFPFLVIFLFFINLLNLGPRIKNLFRIKRFVFSSDYNDSQIDDGRQILETERTARERKERDGVISGAAVVTTNQTIPKTKAESAVTKGSSFMSGFWTLFKKKSRTTNSGEFELSENPNFDHSELNEEL